MLKNFKFKICTREDAIKVANIFLPFIKSKPVTEDYKKYVEFLKNGIEDEGLISSTLYFLRNKTYEEAPLAYLLFNKMLYDKIIEIQELDPNDLSIKAIVALGWFNYMSLSELQKEADYYSKEVAGEIQRILLENKEGDE